MNDHDQDSGNASVDPNADSASNQALARQVVEFVQKLTLQTSIGNVHWISHAGTLRVFEGSNARVELKSIDSDGQLPISFEIFDQTGKRRYAWLVDFHSDEGDVWFDDSIKALWELVYDKDDILASLIEDLDALPPF